MNKAEISELNLQKYVGLMFEIQHKANSITFRGIVKNVETSGNFLTIKTEKMMVLDMSLANSSYVESLKKEYTVMLDGLEVSVNEPTAIPALLLSSRLSERADILFFSEESTEQIGGHMGLL